MIKNLGFAYVQLRPNDNREGELEEGLEDNAEGRQVDSWQLQDYMARQARMTATVKDGD